MIESLRGKDIVDIACGGAHSAAITAAGELYTWGKGRYGRLGHGDSDDQLKPKLVEALIGIQFLFNNYYQNKGFQDSELEKLFGI